MKKERKSVKQRGVSFSDRVLGGQVRNIALGHILKILSNNYKDKSYQKAMLLKLAPSLLPRLSELSGEDGGPLILSLSPIVAKKNGINSSTE